MSTTFEGPTMYERDMRSANKEWRRSKNGSTKWAFGARPLAGCKLDLTTLEPATGSESQRAKVRPARGGKHTFKALNGSGTTNNRSKTFSREEIDDASRSIGELTSTPRLARSMSASDNFLYSFDRVESPGGPVTLDLFVKPASPRDTERLVRKEYEVLDANGQPLKGRKAKKDLRRAALDPTPDADEDDGFELV